MRSWIHIIIQSQFEFLVSTENIQPFHPIHSSNSQHFVLFFKYFFSRNFENWHNLLFETMLPEIWFVCKRVPHKCVGIANRKVVEVVYVVWKVISLWCVCPKTIRDVRCSSAIHVSVCQLRTSGSKSILNWWNFNFQTSKIFLHPQQINNSNSLIQN